MEPLETNRADNVSGQSTKACSTQNSVSSATHDEEFDGWELSRYAAEKKVTQEYVWEKVKSGQLVARCHQGRMYVLEDFHQMDGILKKAKQGVPEEAASIEMAANRDESGQKDVDPNYGGPSTEFGIKERSSESFNQDASHYAQQDGGYLATRPLHHPSEIALLLDHLSLAKEENKDILKLTQEAISQITSMTTSMLSLKEELLTAKEDQLKIYKQQMNEKELQLNKLKQEVEDLKMLTKLLSQD